MYICLDCGRIFEIPRKHIETHGLDFPPYESWNGCPFCGGAYTETHKCDLCGQYVEDEYITTNKGDVICDNCYIIHSIDD